MNQEELIKIWERFTENNDFKLNPDNKIVKMIAEGVLENEKNHQLKLCPCQLRDNTKERDLELLCPCNFKTQKTWKEEGRCWCSLFLKI